MAERPSSAPAPISVAALRRMVLVIEDDKDASEALKNVIEDQGYAAVCVANGAEALAVLRKERPCLMLIDVFMPVMNGVEFLRVVRSDEKLADIPRVIMTAANDRMIGVKEDASVLYKPVDFDGLKRILQKYCDPSCPRSP